MRTCAGRKGIAMIKRLLFVLILTLMVLGAVACNAGLADGNLIGVVVRESSGEPIQRPQLIIGRTLKTPTMPDQQIIGDLDGKFGITVRGGNYTVQIGTKVDGPFYTWPTQIYVAENQTTVVLLKLPEGY